MDSIFSDRITDVPRSFIREILKVTVDPEIISFAGGLPNRELFPIDALKAAANKVFDAYGYRRKQNLDIPVESILITSGSQQGLDLLGKIFLNDGDGMVMEEPGYLGAIQAFSLSKPRFFPIPVSENGMDTDRLRRVVPSKKPKLMYTVPNFQNPSGISYPKENRLEIAEILRGTNTILIEDDPYGELRFKGESKLSFKALLPENTVLLGSFSKTVVPGFRLGWVAAPNSIMEKLIVAKQAADLHTSHFTQSIIYQYLQDNDIEQHILKIREAYGRQCRAMLRSIKKHFPSGVQHTEPEGGMFLWAELPRNLVALDLFELALKDKVIFVPGDPFYVKKTRMPTMRLNFSCVDEKTIDVGIRRLGEAIRTLSESSDR